MLTIKQLRDDREAAIRRLAKKGVECSFGKEDTAESERGF